MSLAGARLPALPGDSRFGGAAAEAKNKPVRIPGEAHSLPKLCCGPSLVD